MGCRLMAMASARHQAIVAAIAAELSRQSPKAAKSLDIAALAAAVDAAIDPLPPAIEGKRPEDLNATNDG